MCGVAGILRFDGAPITMEYLRKMSRALAHRGPDGDGHEILGPCGLAHRRLAIIDLSAAGLQPMSLPDGRLWLTYNGEVYNYVELRRELEARGRTFHTATDSEVILQAYEEYGEAAFEKFNGMWGLGIWDARERTLILSRDRMGVKPLYVHRNQERLLFGSEIKALLAADPKLAELDPRSVARFFVRGPLSFSRDTLFRGIEAIEPGTIVTIAADGRTHGRRYWNFLPRREPPAIAREEAVEQTRALLIDAVRLRFRSDVPVGTCLSGGLDSSSIVSISAKLLGRAPETFSAIYDDPDCDEREFVQEMVREHALSSNTVTPDGSDFPEVIERATYFQDSPTMAHGIYSQWHVMRIASRKVKVLLDGQGGDELFAGYFSYFYPYFQSLMRGGQARELLRARNEIRALSKEDMLRTFLSRTKNDVKRTLLRPVYFARKELRDNVRSLADRYGVREDIAAALRSFKGEPVPSSVTEVVKFPYRLMLRDEEPSWAVQKITGDPLTDVLWDTVVKSSIPQLLHYEDRDSMAFSIEARTPFLDYRLIEHAFQLPSALKLDGALTKVVLREAMKGLLPERVRMRRDKKGYPTPFTRWSRTTLRDWVSDLVLSPRFAQREILDHRVVQKFVGDHLDGKRDYSTMLFQLITFELFCRRFIDRPFRAEEHPSEQLRVEPLRANE